MINQIKQDAQARMTKSIDALRHNLVKVRTGRSSTGLVDTIRVSAYGSEVPLSQVAAVSVSDARSLVITPWDKGMVGAVEKAILASDLGLTPNTAGTTIRLNLPALTEERRRELTKVAAQYAEHARVAIRNVRRDVNDALKKMHTAKEISEDDLHKAQDEVQKTTDNFVKKADAVLAEKEKEIMEI